jgi:hypothetical protein
MEGPRILYPFLKITNGNVETRAMLRNTDQVLR